MFKLFLLVIVLLNRPFAFAINAQDEIAKAQDWVNQFNRPYPIHILDRDKVQFLYIQAQLVGDDKTHDRLKVLRDYLNTTMDIDFSENQLIAVDDYIVKLNSLPTAIPFKVDGSYKFCMVFVKQPNSNAAMEAEDLAGLKDIAIESENKEYKLKSSLAYDDLYRFSLYHETGHCLDRNYLPNAHQAGISPHDIHLGEAFAETVGYLKLASEGKKDIAPTRALYRATFTHFTGSILGKSAQDLDPIHKRAGAIYFLAPYLMEAYSRLESLHEMEKLTTGEGLLAMAHEVVEAKAIDSRAFNAITNLFTQGNAETTEHTKESAQKHPELFYGTYMALLSFQNQLDFWVGSAFSDEKKELEPDIRVPSFPMDSICSAIQNNDQQAYLDALNLHRSRLNESLSLHITVAAQANTLNNILTVASACHGDSSKMVDSTLSQNF